MDYFIIRARLDDKTSGPYLLTYVHCRVLLIIEQVLVEIIQIGHICIVILRGFGKILSFPFFFFRVDSIESFVWVFWFIILIVTFRDAPGLGRPLRARFRSGICLKTGLNRNDKMNASL